MMFILGQGDIKCKNGVKRNIIFDDDIVVCLFYVVVYQLEFDIMIFVGVVGDVVFEDLIVQCFVNVVFLVGDFNDYFLVIIVDQVFDLF